MWQLKNYTRFAADRIVVIDKTGERHWVVVVKGTFTIDARGLVQIADEQCPPVVAPKYRGKDGASSLLCEQDMIAAKPRTDLYLNATAYSPGGRPSKQFNVGLRTPAGRKTLVVTGDRRWERRWFRSPGPSAPELFTTMPITYERAFGGYDQRNADPSKHGLDPRNPIGTGFVVTKSIPRGMPLPNINLPGRGNHRVPAGFGAVCSYWNERMRYQGTYDAKWSETQKPLLPVDFDEQYFQCAPRDQQFAPRLRGGESLELENLTPDGLLRFRLPKHYFAFTTHIGRRRLEHRADLQTVIIDPDERRLAMTWHSTLSCHHDIDDIDFTRVVEKSYV